jgi:tRNA nucleotidyltransferase/poly(A) polymerase
MDPDTERLAREAVAAGALSTVSGARVRDELIDLLSEPESGRAVARMAELGLDRALHPALAKRSFRQVDRNAAEMGTVTKEQMVAWTAEGEGKNEDPGDRRIEVDVVDLHGNIATVIVRSAVYREYLHLVRIDDGWKIVNALWHFT